MVRYAAVERVSNLKPGSNFAFQSACSGCESVQVKMEIPVYICQGIPLADMACPGNSKNARQ